MINQLYTERMNCEANLRNTDYIAAKLAEGVATKEEYADTLQLRQQWRTRINGIDEEIERIKEQEEHDRDNQILEQDSL